MRRTDVTVREVVQHIYCCNDLPRDEQSLDDDLGGDSLDRVELLMDLEEMFGIEVGDDEVEDIKTVGDLVRKMVARVGEEHAD